MVRVESGPTKAEGQLQNRAQVVIELRPTRRMSCTHHVAVQAEGVGELPSVEGPAAAGLREARLRGDPGASHTLSCRRTEGEEEVGQVHVATLQDGAPEGSRHGGGLKGGVRT